MKKFFFISFLGTLVFFTNQRANAQTQSITIDTTITADCEFFPFGSSDAIYSLSITGSLTLHSDTSLVRVVLYDTLFNEYMVYESYPLIASDLSFSFYDVCDETCYLDGVSPYSIEVQIINATLNLSSLTFDPNFINSADSLQIIAKQAVELQKTTQMQSIIIQRKMLWLPDTSTISKMSYTDKQGLFGAKYNMQGLDYYSGGTYMSLAPNFKDNDNSTIVSEWDWRSRHGANDPTKSAYYYDNNAIGEGWMTIAKNQKVRGQCCEGLCYIYAPLGAMEGYTNIFLNRLNTPGFINYDLSEQHVLECDQYDENECVNGSVNRTNRYLRNYGVVDEGCYPHACPDGQCDQIDSPAYRLEIKSSSAITPPYIPELVIKTKLIEKGPFTASLDNFFGYGNHAMVLIGYGKIKVGDIYHTKEGGAIVEKTVEKGNPLVGKTFWKFKNSWGDWGDNGYYYHLDDDLTFGRISYLIGAVDDLTTPETEEPLCFDKDNDGYFNWGIYDNTPNECENKFSNRDSDDSNPRLGPFDEDYYSTPVAPIMEVYDDANPNPNIIPNNTFYSFYDDASQPITFTFTIVNNGDAQLNLRPSSPVAKTITISGDNENDFELYLPPEFQTEIPMGGGSTVFDITFILTAPIDKPKIATVTIHVDEDDMDDYVFTLVFTDCSLPNAETEILTAPEVNWNTTMVKFGDVLVSQGTILNVTGDVAFKDGAGLFIDRGGLLEPNNNIEPGGKVYIKDGGRLTSLCNSKWKGVDVWGYYDESQYPDQEGDYSQGYIKLLNGGSISNAQVGIETIEYRNDKAMTETSGGIVIIDEGAIENCDQGVVFYPYVNFHPCSPTSEPQPNWSYFRLAQFYNSRNFAPVNQLKMTGVDGIKIEGCSFENYYYIESPVNPPTGISSHNSTFTLGSFVPLPWNGDPVQTSFKNFNKAISAINSGDETVYGNIRIDSVYFEDNIRGIYMSAVNYSVIINNEFNVRKRFSFFPEDEEMIGLYINDESIGYVVEENSFYTELHSSKLETVKCAGIHLTNTGGYANEIYSNKFNDLSVGITAAGSNQDGNGVGLCIKCNDFRDCFNDIYITYEGGSGNLGIATDQGVPVPVPPEGEEGDPTWAAGNTFSNTDNQNPDNYNYANLDGCNTIIYTYHGSNQTSFKIIPEPVYPPSPSQQIDLSADNNVSYNSKSEACPSNYSGGGIDVMTTSSTFSLELSSVEAYEDTLGMFVDGGDTESLAWDVNMSTPPEATEVRQELLNESPYLSDTVMKAAIAKENVLPNAMVRDVLVANPQSAKSAEILQAIDERNDTMPEYMMDQILLGQNIFGDKEILEQKLAKHKTIKGKAMAQLMHHYLADTTDRAAATDSIIGLLENDSELPSRYQLVMKYLGMKDSANAFGTFNSIAAEFDLNTRQETEYELYEDLLDLKWQMITDTTLPDSLTIDALFDIEAYHNTTPGVCARNILIGLSELVYNEPVYFPDFTKATPIWCRSKKSFKAPSVLNVFPNPAGSYFIAEYKLLETFGTNMLVLTDINGNNILVIDIRKKQNQVVIPTSGIKSGVYILQLISSSKVKESVKISIVK